MARSDGNLGNVGSNDNGLPTFRAPGSPVPVARRLRARLAASTTEASTGIPDTNPLERLNKEMKRRADVVGIFPNDGSIIRLIGAVLLQANDGWQLQHRYRQTEAMADLIPRLLDVVPTQISTVAA